MSKDNHNEELVFHSKTHDEFSISFSDISVLSDFPNSYVGLVKAIKKVDHLYVLLNVFFSSRSSGAMGRCGAGEEHYLVWIDFDKNRNVNDLQEVIYSSCYLSIEISEATDFYPPIHNINDGLSMSVIHLFSDRIRMIEFDVTMPEKGITVTEH